MYAHAMSPDRHVPCLNDSGRVDVPMILSQGLELFPNHEDWRWIASDGEKGSPPKERRSSSSAGSRT